MASGIVAAFHKLSKVEELIKVDPEANGARWEKCNLDFHNALVSACQNRWLFYFRNILQSQSSRYLRLALKTSIKERDVHAEHEAIFRAALARNSAEISDLIDQHIDQEQKRRSDFRSYAQAATVGIVGLQVLNETFPCADLDVGFQNEGAGTLQAEGGERPEDAADGAGETSETSSSSSSGSAARDLIKGLLGR